MTPTEREDAATELALSIFTAIGKRDWLAVRLGALKLGLLAADEAPAAALPAPVVADVPKHFSDVEKGD